MKLNTLLTASIISLALLSGCDKGSEQTASTSGESATPAPAETAAPAPAAEEAK